MTIENFLTKVRFSKLIEATVLEKKMSYLDAILFVCEENHIDVEDVKKYISVPLKQRLQAEAVELRYIQADSSQLPI
jgi:hypothetical protein